MATIWLQIHFLSTAKQRTSHLISWCPMLSNRPVDIMCAKPQKLFLHHMIYHVFQLNKLRTQMSTVKINTNTHIKTHTHTHTQPFYGSVDFVRHKPVPEEIFTHSHSSWSSIIPICFLHLLQSMASSLFNPRALQSFSTISLQVFFGIPGM